MTCKCTECKCERKLEKIIYQYDDGSVEEVDLSVAQPTPQPVYLDFTGANKPDFTNPVVGKCSKCGIDLYRVMGYYCNRTNCPTGLGGITC